jgi:hypothetical protein
LKEGEWSQMTALNVNVRKFVWKYKIAFYVNYAPEVVLSYTVNRISEANQNVLFQNQLEMNSLFITNFLLL